MSRYEVTPIDPQGRAHGTRILPSKAEAEALAKEMRAERRGTGWRYVVSPFPRPAERRNSVLGELDRLLSKAEDVIGRHMLTEAKETDPALYRFGNDAFDKIEGIRRKIASGRL